MLVFLIGFMGSGKTSYGKIVAEALSLPFYDLDEVIEMNAKRTVAEIFETDGEKAFREIESSALISLFHLENAIIATGGGAPCHHNHMEMMNRKGITIYIKQSPQQLMTNLLDTDLSIRPLIANLNKTELKSYISNKLKERESFYAKAKFEVSGSGEDIINQLTEYIAKIRNN